MTAGVVPPQSTPDPHDARLVRSGSDLLRVFNKAGVLGPADVHVATTLSRLTGEVQPHVLLGIALAVRAPRFGHVCADLATVRGTVAADEDNVADLDRLPWPEAPAWHNAMVASPLVDVGSDAAGERPLRLIATRLYLDRYWRYERRVVDGLVAHSTPDASIDRRLLRAGLERLFPIESDEDQPDWQRLAAAAAILRHFAVIAGGPGTGKTTTVARVLALAEEQAAGTGRRPPRVAMAAPTGKAAARLQDSVRTTAVDLHVSEEIRARLSQLEASTLHRLLGVLPAHATRFFHHRNNPLPHDLIVVDETSMVSLGMMAKLLDAVRRDARLVLVGDPQQLASVEAGSVLGDIVGPGIRGLCMTSPARQELAKVAGVAVPASDPPEGAAMGDGIVVLRRGHRFGGGSGIAAFAEAIQQGDSDGALAVLAEGQRDVRWVNLQAGRDSGLGLPKTAGGRADDDHSRDTREQALEPVLEPVRTAVVAAGTRLLAAGRAGDAREALHALGQLRVLCAHRHGPFGVSTWMVRVESWLARGVAAPARSARPVVFDPGQSWYLGRPVLVTRNDYQLGVFNGDTGVAVAQPDGRMAVAFATGGDIRLVSPARLEAVETVHAMTIHKSQGSQFRQVVVVLPDAASPALSRELLYTAVTRAREVVMLVGTEGAVRSAIERPVLRASGLRQALWGSGG